MSEEIITVTFKAEYRTDRGFRVYATGPTGLYVSSESTYAAAEYFQNLLPCVVADPKREDCGIAMLDTFNWREIAANGYGQCRFMLVSKERVFEETGEDVSRSRAGSEEDFPTPVGAEPEVAEVGLQVVTRKTGDKEYLVVTDPGETDPVLEEIIARQELAQ